MSWGEGRSWVDLTFLRDPAGGWVVEVYHSNAPWPVFDVGQVRVAFAEPEAITVVDG